jgi:hypothetical protein
MYGVFRNIGPPSPHRSASVYPLAFGARGGHTRWVERGWGVNISEDARHCSVLYIYKYFVISSITFKIIPTYAYVQIVHVYMYVNIVTDRHAKAKQTG